MRAKFSVHSCEIYATIFDGLLYSQDPVSRVNDWYRSFDPTFVEDPIFGPVSKLFRAGEATLMAIIYVGFFGAAQLFEGIRELRMRFYVRLRQSSE